MRTVIALTKTPLFIAFYFKTFLCSFIGCTISLHWKHGGEREGGKEERDSLRAEKKD